MADNKIITQLIELAFSFFKPKVEQKTQPSTPAPQPEKKVENMIDWTKEDCKVSKYFTVKECLWLPQWKRLANEADGLDDSIKSNLINLCKRMDTVREYFGKPIRVHVTLRPEEYNKLIGGAKNSVHKYGGAMDFDIIGITCDDARKKMVDEKKLEEWNMRCEDAPGTNWVHLDIKELSPGGHRFFKP